MQLLKLLEFGVSTLKSLSISTEPFNCNISSISPCPEISDSNSILLILALKIDNFAGIEYSSLQNECTGASYLLHVIK